MTLRPRAGFDVVPPGLTRMRLVATGLLIAMALLFLVSRPLVGVHPAWGFVRAFAEAGMIGGMADWFAVTALFRHPLGLPIPHTAIVPNNKERIGDQLGQFLRENFLITTVIARRMHRLDVAGAIARWLTDPAEGAGGTFRAGASKLVAQVLEALDPQRLGGLLKLAIANRVREAELAPILGRLLKAAMAEGRHLPLLEAGIRWAASALADNDHLIRQIVHDKAGAILRWTGLDETVANKLIDGLGGLLSDMASDPQHPLRLRAENGLDTLAWDLRFDPAMAARVAKMRDDLIDNPAVSNWLEGLWEQARGMLLAIARDPEKAMRGRLGDVLRQLGETLQNDRRLARTINRFVRRAVVGVATDYGDGITRLVSETVRSWDTHTITRRLENAVGKDLQYIRVNGTLVGGLVGLLIHGVDIMLG